MSSIFRPWSTSGASWRNYRHWYSAPSCATPHSHTCNVRAPHVAHPRVSSSPPPPWQLFPRNADELLEELLLSTFGFQIFLMEGKHEVSSSSLGDLWRLAEGVEAWNALETGKESSSLCPRCSFFSSFFFFFFNGKDIKWLVMIDERSWNVCIKLLDRVLEIYVERCGILFLEIWIRKGSGRSNFFFWGERRRNGFFFSAEFIDKCGYYSFWIRKGSGRISLTNVTF